MLVYFHLSLLMILFLDFIIQIWPRIFAYFSFSIRAFIFIFYTDLLPRVALLYSRVVLLSLFYRGKRRFRESPPPPPRRLTLNGYHSYEWNLGLPPLHLVLISYDSNGKRRGLFGSLALWGRRHTGCSETTERVKLSMTHHKSFHNISSRPLSNRVVLEAHICIPYFSGTCKGRRLSKLTLFL